MAPISEHSLPEAFAESVNSRGIESLWILMRI